MDPVSAPLQEQLKEQARRCRRWSKLTVPEPWWKDAVSDCGRAADALDKAAELAEAAREAYERIDTFFGPSGTNNLDRPLLERLAAALTSTASTDAPPTELETGWCPEHRVFHTSTETSSTLPCEVQRRLWEGASRG